ncbi:DUF3307 domain-containing protein [Piscibacillus salipiscarius]|uniref:DUF3307 domain-containing protein n=1 Tax=Piscibacillus salipiscarius TaxID=299480 RepID=A0ABW5Q687_9BACI|nr:DUF3307 domain-containing protein [Piscibacillus salipiscarius]
MVYLALLILAHFIADFSFQSDDLIKGRKDPNFKVRNRSLLKHVMIHFVTAVSLALIGILITQSINLSIFLMLIIIITLMTVTHYAIDAAKYHLDQQLTSQKWKALLFLLDQLLHLIIITIPFIYLMQSFHIVNNGFDYWIIILILIYLNTVVASHFLQIVLEKITPPNTMEQIVEEEVDRQEKDEDPQVHTVITRSKTSYPDSNHKIGRYIGMLERTLIMMFVFSNQVMGITIILAIKSITRFKQFEDKRFAEYYLIGTLLSMIIGIMFGYLAGLI